MEEVSYLDTFSNHGILPQQEVLYLALGSLALCVCAVVFSLSFNLALHSSVKPLENSLSSVPNNSVYTP